MVVMFRNYFDGLLLFETLDGKRELKVLILLCFVNFRKEKDSIQMDAGCKVQRCLLATLLVCAIPLLVGCGRGGPNVVPVSGQVLIDGEPLATGIPGFIQVVPVEGRAASSPIDPQTGRFTLTTWEDGDGCQIGTHKVVVMVEQAVDTSTVSLVPEKYSDLNSTDLTVTIEGPTDSLVVELTGPLRKVRTATPTFEGEPHES